jgi:hypothetical protein
MEEQEVDQYRKEDREVLDKEDQLLEVKDPMLIDKAQEEEVIKENNSNPNVKKEE